MKFSDIKFKKNEASIDLLYKVELPIRVKGSLEVGEGLRGVVAYDIQTNEILSFGLLSTDEMLMLFGAFTE